VVLAGSSWCDVYIFSQVDETEGANLGGAAVVLATVGALASLVLVLLAWRARPAQREARQVAASVTFAVFALLALWVVPYNAAVALGWTS
jgi:hypothetical protein